MKMLARAAAWLSLILGLCALPIQSAHAEDTATLPKSFALPLSGSEITSVGVPAAGGGYSMQAVTLNQQLNSTTAKLQRAASRAAAANPEDAGLSPFTVSLATAEDTTTYSRVYSSASTIKLVDVVRVAGAVPLLYSNGAYFMPSTNTTPGTGGNLSAFFGSAPWTPFDQGREATVWSASFQTDTEAALQIRLSGTSSTHFYRLMVDGLYLNKTPQALVGTGNVDVVTVTLDSKPHVVTIESSQTASLSRIRVAPTATISKPVGSPDQVIGLALGDSYSEGFGSEYRFMGAWPKTVANLLGVSDMRIVGLGGTGYIQANTTSGAPKVADQIAGWKLSNPDLVAADGTMPTVSIVPVGSGYNDWNNTSAAIADAALDAWRKMRAQCPNALIVVMGPWAGIHGEADTKTLADENALKAKFVAWGDRNALFVPINTDTTPWISGTGKVGATTGDGNADLFMANENPRVHPSFAGHQWIARRLAAAIRAYLGSLGAVSAGYDLPRTANDNEAERLAA